MYFCTLGQAFKNVRQPGIWASLVIFIRVYHKEFSKLGDDALSS